MPISSQPETGRLDLSASAGAYRAADFQIVNATGSAVTGWTGASNPVIEVWTGDDREPLTGTGLSAVWSSAANGIVKIESSGAHTLSPASYFWRMLATFDTKTYEICRGVYSIATAPGAVDTDPLPAVAPYTTLDDLLTLAPWIQSAQGINDRTGFAEHQEAARQWFDGLILASWRNSSGTVLELAYPWGRTVGEPPQWLRDVLASGQGVMITPQIRRACAAYALAYICGAQLVTNENESSYRLKAGQYRAMARNEAVAMTVYVKPSVSSTGYSIAIQLGIGARN